MFPKLVLTGSERSSAVLPRIPLASGDRDEAWLRDLLLRHPQTLPAAEIDPAFAEPISVCGELMTPCGPIDALFVNRNGALIVVECKLWRNPQARREVVGQILDYAKELARFRYEDLQREVSRRLGVPGNVLYRLVADRDSSVSEAAFVDAVARNLRRGRFLLLVAGDGIREGTEAIVEFLQSHSGLNVTFGLVEMAGYEMPDGTLLVQPRLMARSVTLERRLVRVVEPNGETVEVTEQEELPQSGTTTALVEADRRFWQRFLDRLRFDDPSQEKPTRTGVGRVRYKLGIDGIVMGTWRTRPGSRMSTFISFQGDLARGWFGVFEAQREEITAQLLALAPDAWVEWETEPSGDRYVALRRNIPGIWDEAAEEAQIDWMVAAANAFVNIFKPTLRRLAQGEQLPA